MNDLDRRRKRLDLSRVRVAREELQLKIEERLDEIERLKAHIATQEATEQKILTELGEI